MNSASEKHSALESRLLNQIQMLKATTVSTEEQSGINLDEMNADEIEVATCLETARSASIVSENLYQELRQAEAALQRLRSGTYGICQICEEPMSQKRLNAVPHATLCIDCQGEAERGRGRSVSARFAAVDPTLQ